MFNAVKPGTMVPSPTRGARSGPTSEVVHGTTADGFEAVREAFAANFRERGELGAACAVYHRGETVVDLWGGHRDADAELPWERDTMVLVYSTTKGLAATAVALARSRGLFDYDDRVADHWPAFGQRGKSAVTIRQLLGHQAGLAALDVDLSPAEIADREALSDLLARKRPDWEPGTRHGYHAVSLGWYESELLRHADGRSLGEFFAEEVADSLDLSFYVGLPEHVSDERVATLDQVGVRKQLSALAGVTPKLLLAYLYPRSLLRRSLGCLDVDDATDLNDSAFRAVEIPAANGIGEVRAVAKLYGDLATGGDRLGVVDDVLDELTARPSPPTGGWADLVLKVDAAYSLGFSKPHGDFQFGRTHRSFGTPGLGGSFGFADPDAGLGFAYAPNRLGAGLRDDQRQVALREAVYECLDDL